MHADAALAACAMKRRACLLPDQYHAATLSSVMLHALSTSECLELWCARGTWLRSPTKPVSRLLS